MDYEKIERLNIEELKNYVKCNGLKVSGRKKELVARAFAAFGNDVKPVKTAVEVEAVKLVLDERKMTDPIKITHGWQNEEEGMVFWPIILYPGIFSHLVFSPSVHESLEIKTSNPALLQGLQVKT